MPWSMFQSEGHLDTSIVNPSAPTYRSGLLASWPYFPVPAAGMTLPLADAAAAVVAAVVAGAVVAAAVVAAAVVAAEPLSLLSPPQAAATRPTDTSSAV